MAAKSLRTAFRKLSPATEVCRAPTGASSFPGKSPPGPLYDAVALALAEVLFNSKARELARSIRSAGCPASWCLKHLPG